jgi:hypothetical protein
MMGFFSSPLNSAISSSSASAAAATGHILYNTSILYIPPTASGLRNALSALTWVSSSNEGSERYGAHRLAIVVNSPR